MTSNKSGKQNWASLLDALTLCILIVAMCSQINLGDIGQDTTAKGYVTKQLKIALPDIALFACFGWFFLRTTWLRAWKKLWWPPFPCWALISALVVSALHSRPLLTPILESLAEAEGLKEMLKALLSAESKEAIAETIQFAGYFVIAPLLFVNLIHDRRLEIFLSRRKLALRVFGATLVLVAIHALWQLLTAKPNLQMADAPHSLFGTTEIGSPNAYAAFIALSLPLVLARFLWDKHGAAWTIGLSVLSVVVFAATLVSPFATLILLTALLLAGLLLRAPKRAVVALGLSALLLLVIWPQQIQLAPMRQELWRVGSAQEKVRKQYVEWYVGASRLGDQREASFATGVGPGNYQINIGSYYSQLPNEEKMPPDSNNLYLVQAINIGLLGLGALLWVLVHFARIAWAARRQYPGDWLAQGVLASLAAWLLVNCFHASIVRGTGIVLAFVLSLAVIAWQRDDEVETAAGQSKSPVLP